MDIDSSEYQRDIQRMNETGAVAVNQSGRPTEVNESTPPPWNAIDFSHPSYYNNPQPAYPRRKITRPTGEDQKPNPIYPVRKPLNPASIEREKKRKLAADADEPDVSLASGTPLSLMARKAAFASRRSPNATRGYPRVQNGVVVHGRTSPANPTAPAGPPRHNPYDRPDLGTIPRLVYTCVGTTRALFAALWDILRGNNEIPDVAGTQVFAQETRDRAKRRAVEIMPGTFPAEAPQLPTPPDSRPVSRQEDDGAERVAAAAAAVAAEAAERERQVRIAAEEQAAAAARRAEEEQAELRRRRAVAPNPAPVASRLLVRDKITGEMRPPRTYPELGWKRGEDGRWRSPTPPRRSPAARRTVTLPDSARPNSKKAKEKERERETAEIDGLCRRARGLSIPTPETTEMMEDLLLRYRLSRACTKKEIDIVVTRAEKERHERELKDAADKKARIEARSACEAEEEKQYWEEIFAKERYARKKAADKEAALKAAEKEIAAKKAAEKAEQEKAAREAVEKEEAAKKAAEEEEAAKKAEQEKAARKALEEAEAAKKAADEAKAIAEEEARQAIEAGLKAEAEAKAEATRKAADRAAPLIRTLTPEWAERVDSALATKDAKKTLAKAVDGVELSRYDFGRLAPTGEVADGTGPAGWLNDNTVNAFFTSIVAAKKEETGYVKGPNNTPAIEAFNSAWYTSVTARGTIQAIKTWSRRKGIQGEKLLKAEKIFFPVNTGGHWSLLIISPQTKEIEYLDSMNHNGTAVTKLAREWLEMELGSKYDMGEWKVVTGKSGWQTNGSDCGVFACLNGLAAAKSRPFRDVEAGRMKDGRRMIAAILINGGLTGDFKL